MCTVKGCDREHWARGYCRRHVSLFYSHGKIPKRTRLDPNDIILEGDVAFIILRDTRGKEVGKAIIDVNYVDLIKKHKWYLNNTGYAITRINSTKQMLLHRLIMSPPDDVVIDHIDGNTLNNRSSNLRLCTQQQNLFNSKIRLDNTSGVTGVGFDKKRNLWRARIHANKKDLHLGYFEKFEDAVDARHEAEKKYFGEFRRVEVEQ